MSYITISSQEKHNFSLCSCFHALPTTLLLKILGGPMHGPSPHLEFWGDRPPSPPRSPPLFRPITTTIHQTIPKSSRLHPMLHRTASVNVDAAKRNIARA